MSDDPARALERLYRELLECRRCPRLVAWREKVGRQKRRAFQNETYWARPVPGFGDPAARLLIFGLAPGAHGSNRTGRMFTGDASGNFLYPALWRAGLASQPQASGRDDGLELHGVYITAAVRCAPPANKPTRQEFAACSYWTERELALLPGLRVYLALGRLAHDALLERYRLAKTRHPFGHGRSYRLPDGRVLLDSYHVSRQNTQTGRLTEEMFAAVLERAKELAGLG
ncbi:uracil-DNA glycosylase [Oceanithermus sp.]